MNKSRLLGAVYALLVFCISSLNVQATIITTDCVNTNASCTLQELLDGGAITIDDKEFTNWTFSDISSGVSVSPSEIDVVALDDDPLNPGLDFQFDLFSTGQNFDFVYGFQVGTTDGTARIKDNSLELIEFTRVTPALLQVSETITELGGAEIASKFVGAENFTTGLTTFDSVTFTPRADISVETHIVIEGGIGGSAGLGRVEQRFSQVPIPAAVWLFGSGLLGLVGIARKKVA